MNAAALLALPALGLAGVVIALMKTAALTETHALGWLALAASLPLLGALVGALRPVAPLLAAKLLDRAHDLDDRVTNAVSFAALNERTPFMDAAIDDARMHAKTLRPQRAMPLRVPRDAVPVLGLTLGVALLAFLEVPRHVEERASGSGIVPVVLHPDDLDAFDSGLRELMDDPATSEDVRGAARELNRLIEDLADERLDRAETLRRIAELEQRLSDTRPASAELLRESLAQVGRDLARASLADELSQAMRDGDAERAESEMRALAERMRSGEPNRAELERLRRALAQAAATRPEGRSEELREREEQMNRLLQRQREQQETEQDQRLLQRRQRELERLRRDHQDAMEQRRQLDRLQRELDEAAQALEQNDRSQAAENMEQGAEDLNRMAREQMSGEEMRRMQQQLAELRELIRRQRQAQGGQQGQRGQGQQGQQQGQGGQGQSRMDRFVLRARGQGEGEGTPLGVPGEGGRRGQQGQGSEGQGESGDGQGGQGGEREMLVLGGQGEGDAILEIPGLGQQQGGGGPGPARQGPGAGIGHDPTMLDDPTRLGGSRQTVRIEGQQGQGPTRSEVILSSAQRGFSSRDYRDVYTDYSSHAEEVLEQDEVPPGYRFYVRRYFQLIRPRDE